MVAILVKHQCRFFARICRHVCNGNGKGMLRAAADRERRSPVDHDLDCAFASWHRRAVRDEAEGNLCLDRGVHLRVSQSHQRDACSEEQCGVLRDRHFCFSGCEVLWRRVLLLAEVEPHASI
jgi:hypothetical protein